MIHVEITKRINQPIEKVFDRLVDLPAYSDWMPRRSLLIRSRKTSEGSVGQGTTFSDTIKNGKAVGEITEYEKPRLVSFRQTAYLFGIKILESRPSYRLEKINGDTLVNHYAEGEPAGVFRILEPVLRIFAIAERKRTVKALKESLED